jgi:hypothetical protein
MRGEIYVSIQLLTEEFLAKYPDFPEHQSEISTFVYLRTYSRYLPSKKRRETWKETACRAAQYNVSLAYKHLVELYGDLSVDILARLRTEAEYLFDQMFNLRQFLSGRTLWVGGADNSVAEKYPMANFNCSYVGIDSLYNLTELFYNLLVGVGVGFKCTPKMAAKLEPVRNNLLIKHDPYNSLYPTIKVADSSIVRNGDTVTIYVGDSKEGWVTALKYFLDVHIQEEYADVNVLKINYDYVRKNGERLKTFGGTASGAEPMIEMFQSFESIIKNKVDTFLDDPVEVAPGYVQLRPIHVLDMGNCIGYNVVVGGVRRTAEIFGIGDDPEVDWECVFAKYGVNGIWDQEGHDKVIRKLYEMGNTEWAAKLESLTLMDPNARPLHHRRMSNNSIAFTKKPTRGVLNLVFEMMQREGEPGFVNLRELAVRRLKGMGIDNPTEAMIEDMMEQIFMNPLKVA